MPKNYQEYLKYERAEDHANLMITTYHGLAIHFKAVRDTILANALETAPEVMRHLEEMIATLDEMQKYRYKKTEDGDAPYLTEAEWNHHNDVMKSMIQLMNSKVGGRTMLKLLEEDLDINPNIVLSSAKRIGKGNELGMFSFDPSLDDAFGNYYAMRQKNGAEWKDAKKAYGKMASEIASLMAELELTNEEKQEMKEWEDRLKLLAGETPQPVNADQQEEDDIDPEEVKEQEMQKLRAAFEKVNTPDAFDTLLNKEIGGKSVFRHVFDKADDNAKKVSLYTAQNYMKKHHGVKVFPRAIKTAYNWIERFQAKDKLVNTNPETGKKTLNAERLSMILAARQLANAERKKPANLKKTKLTDTEIRDRAHELMNEPLFQKYISELKKNPEKLQKAAELSGEGHGGAFEMDFKAFIMQQPAGELPNKPIFKRYMPTLKERIRILDSQLKNGGSRTATAAEIVVLRNLVQAGTDIPVPTDTYNSLQNKTKLLAENLNFKKLTMNASLTEGILKDNGATMVQKLRKSARAKWDYEDGNPISYNFGSDVKVKNDQMMVLDENTIKGELNAVRLKAGRLQAQLMKMSGNNANANQKDEVSREFKKILKSYLVLNHMTRENLDIPSWDQMGILNEAVYEKKMAEVAGKDMDRKKYNRMMNQPAGIPSLKMLDAEMTEDEMYRTCKIMVTKEPISAMKEMGKHFGWDLVVPEIHEKAVKENKGKAPAKVMKK